jgi:CheY-like chemotaxis protein
VVGESTPQKHGGLVDIGKLIQQAQNIARLTWARSDQPLEFRAEIEPELWVRANRGELIEVFLNLFKNSLEAMISGGCLWVRAMRSGGSIMIEVEDDGPGISADIQKRLFKPFASDKGVRGQGLGLAVSRGILQSLGGSINFDSKPGRGTTMIIQLPAGPDRPQQQQEQPSNEPSPPQGAGRRILLVEDEGLVALGVSAILRQEGYQVWQAQDLAEAENMLPEALPEIVLCDFGLPDGNAGDMFQITQRWAGERGGAEPVFVVLTGWSEAQLTDDPSLLTFEPFTWLQKPVDKKELLDTLRDALQKT